MPSSVAHARTLPLYLQISERLTREIAAGHWADGERLPTEVDLAAKLGVAVGTLRKALAELAARGLLVRRQGSGTYVHVPAAAPTPSALQARSVYDLFRLELLEGGGLPTAQVLALDRVCAPQAAAVAWADSYRVRRLRCLNRVPIAIEEIWFAAEQADARFHRPLGIADLHESLYHFYQQDLGFWIARVEDRIGLGTVPPWGPTDARTGFAPAPGTPVCQVERWSWSASGPLGDYSRTWFDADRARYTARWR